jgi:hydroxymethylpyrimidine/phosphomethylpyrimidine kinase
MSNAAHHPIALTIAGSDSGGEAGLQADLRTFRDFDVHGCSVVTAVTAQNQQAVTDVHVVPAETIRSQIQAVRCGYAVGAAKTGMLANSSVVDAVAAEFATCGLPLIVDPVLISSSGTRLLDEEAEALLVGRLMPLAVLVTPNVPEAGRLLNTDGIDQLDAADRLAEILGTSVLVKGGHLDSDCAIDILVTGNGAFSLSTPRLPGGGLHGSGCIVSAAVAAGLASGKDLLESAVAAKAYIHSRLLGGVKDFADIEVAVERVR